ncbi:TldD/PmbA family protein [Cytophagaceae bacterium DM2B3-1]|uniref:TldD/PmbA family protein n=1 Tax=Xanthocytophaga flava TaxID=3048013 RepID=A0ABT7CQG3_9BACT|nr:TldD/PmbA family protein [Xanthocytophaga flavus]MDJ1468097.1 TldD/PmbA family protein [Xanthocytophaga flavus]MDJ1495993.1 TldD/PmbA family protein [Xanthocytophaga flavus]
MAILSKEEAKQLLTKVLGYSKADECSISLNSNHGGNIRYARNTVSTSGEETNMTLSVQSSFGKKTGTASINEFDSASLEKVVKRAEELARLAPENPEYVSILGPQQYAESKAYFDSTGKIDPEFRANVAEKSILPASKKDITAAGFLEHSSGFSSIMNSKGLFAYHTQSDLNFTVTMRTNDGLGSGWVTRDFNDAAKLDSGEASEIAIQKAIGSRSAKAIEPGKYTVVLEPAAAVDLIENMMRSFNARNADEGRSFLSKKGGGNKLGEKLLDERISIYSDPLNAEVPGSTWTNDGLPRKRTDWIQNGVVKTMAYDRFWAQKKGTEAIAFPSNIIIPGGNGSLEDLIKGTEKGILVTRFWYIRSVDPQTLLYTGLTRDGTFYIENGQIKYPVKNFRFNESPVIMLNNLDAMGKAQRVNGNLIPPMRIRDFTFTSLSDAV